MPDYAANRPLSTVAADPERQQTIMARNFPASHPRSLHGPGWGPRVTHGGGSPDGYDRSVRNSTDVENRVASAPSRVAGAEVPSQCWPAIALESRGPLDRGRAIDSCTRGRVAEAIGIVPGKNTPPPHPTHRSARQLESANPYPRKEAALFLRTALVQRFQKAFLQSTF